MKENAETTQKEAAGSQFQRVGECLYRHSSSGIYYGLVKRAGKQFRRSLKTTDRKLAQRRLASLREKVGKLDTATGSKWVTFKDVASKWFETKAVTLKASSKRRRETSLNNIFDSFGDSPIRNINRTDCDGWMVKRNSSGIKARTFNLDRETLVQVFDYAIREGLIMENPAVHLERMKPDKKKLLIPTKDQFRLLVKTIRSADIRASHAGDLVELLGYSGMRLGEAVCLLWSDVNLEQDCFTVTGGETGTKNHEARTVPLFPALRNLLERMKSEYQPEPSMRVIPIDTAKKAMMTACAKAKLPHFHHHSMRHFFVSNAIEAGIDFKVIAGWVGHKDGGVLVAKTYGHLRDSHSFEMAKRMSFDLGEQEPENLLQLRP